MRRITDTRACHQKVETSVLEHRVDW